MTKKTLVFILIIGSIFCTYFVLNAQVTIYNNFGTEHDGWDYNYQTGWTVCGEDHPTQYGVEQAMEFTSTEDGILTDIWLGLFSVPDNVSPDTLYVKVASNSDGLPPDPANILEEWMITGFEDWTQWSPPVHMICSGLTNLEQGESYWLWLTASDQTNTGWCLNIDPSLLCQHTLRREGEDWLNIGNETASAFRVDLNGVIISPPINLAVESNANFNFATFTWDAPATDDLTGYDVYLDGELMGNTTELEWIFTDLVNGMIYEAGVATVYDEGISEIITLDFTYEGTSTNDLQIPNTSLLNNYPNPFNPTTNITFSLAEPTHTTIEIYNVKGENIKTLVDKTLSADNHKVVWDGTDKTNKLVSSGVYFYKMKAGMYTNTKKMILMK